jgi:hypothetical protein
MSKIYLVMERFYQWTDEYYQAAGDNVCGRPERIFTNFQEAEIYCNHLNRLVRPIRACAGGWETDGRATLGFCKMEHGNRDELPDEGWGSFDVPGADPYRIIEVDRDEDETETALAFNQQSAPTYQQCHEIAHFFGLRSAMEVGLPEYRTPTPEEQAKLDYLDSLEEEQIVTEAMLAEAWEWESEAINADYFGEWDEEEWAYKPTEKTQKWKSLAARMQETQEQRQKQDGDLFRHLPQPQFAWATLRDPLETQRLMESFRACQIDGGNYYTPTRRNWEDIMDERYKQFQAQREEEDAILLQYFANEEYIDYLVEPVDEEWENGTK